MHREDLLQINPLEYSELEYHKNDNKNNQILFFCERITLEGAIWGKLEIEENYIIFTSLDG